MTTRTLQYLIEAVLLIWSSIVVRGVVAATAIATITVTISLPTPDVNGLSLSSMQLDMQGKSNEQLTITNLTHEPREVLIELSPASGTVNDCSLRYSPVTSSIPPGGHQVVRLLLLSDEVNPCLTDYQLEISDLHRPDARLFSVPLYTAQRFN